MNNDLLEQDIFKFWSETRQREKHIHTNALAHTHKNIQTHTQALSEEAWDIYKIFMKLLYYFEFFEAHFEAFWDPFVNFFKPEARAKWST